MVTPNKSKNKLKKNFGAKIWVKSEIKIILTYNYLVTSLINS